MEKSELEILDVIIDWFPAIPADDKLEAKEKHALKSRTRLEAWVSFKTD